MALNTEDKEKIESMYYSGKSQDHIGRVFGTNQTIISNFMNRHGIKARITGVPATSFDKKKVVDLYNSGMTQVEIANTLAVGKSIIFRFMKKHNIKRMTKKAKKGRKIKKLQNLKPVKAQEIVVDARNASIDYETIRIKKKYTQFSDELNLYIPEKWNVNKIW